MITFHKLTQYQYDKVVQNNNLVKDGLYFITDTGVIKLCNGEGSVTTFGTNVTIVEQFPDSNNVKPFCIYVKQSTKQQKIWDGSEWHVLSYPNVNQITSDVLDQNAKDTNPTSKAVANYVGEQIAAAQLGVQVKLHTPVHVLQQLEDLPLEDVGDKCMILVQTVGLYRYDSESIDYDDPTTDAVITPKQITNVMPEGADPRDYPGRWIKMFNNVGYIKGNGINISPNPNDVNQIISLNVNPDQFAFNDGKLSLNAVVTGDIESRIPKIQEGHNDEIATFNNDRAIKATGFKFNTTNNLTNNANSISPDSVISAFVQNIADQKTNKIAPNNDQKIVIGSGNDGDIDASQYNIGKDTDDLTSEDINSIPNNTVATEKAMKWYIDRSLSFNSDEIDTHFSY